MTWLVEEKLTWVLPSGERRPGRIAVGMPELVSGSDGEATCAYALEGLETIRGPVHGQGTFQALLVAFQFLGLRLHDYLSRGVRVLMPDGEEGEKEDPELDTATLIYIFGSLIRPPGASRGPADPEGKLAALEAKVTEMENQADD